MLDTRQYRSDQNQALRLDPGRTILGGDQDRWLMANLAGPTARWNVLAEQVFFPASATAATELVGTSITRGGDGVPVRR